MRRGRRIDSWLRPLACRPDRQGWHSSHSLQHAEKRLLYPTIDPCPPLTPSSSAVSVILTIFLGGAECGSDGEIAPVAADPMGCRLPEWEWKRGAEGEMWAQ